MINLVTQALAETRRAGYGGFGGFVARARKHISILEIWALVTYFRLFWRKGGHSGARQAAVTMLKPRLKYV